LEPPEEACFIGSDAATPPHNAVKLRFTGA
jgi:hypothetical protein